ncbi:cation-dependent mannose-6-phosphate receptor-like [Sycon ciliatum]|uniref:cation-dependent mannose-6-phosphate receptor-like n=1 Tax=Sycon ciliatum TaxID=27933 RepID=UPI0020AB7A27|eukprot:scpid77970/ scgid35086/ 
MDGAALRPSLLAWFSLSVALCYLVQEGHAQFPGQCESTPTKCSCVYTDVATGKKMTYDLGDLSNGDGTFRYTEVRGNDQNLYWFNPCASATIPSSGGCEDVIACQLWNNIFSGLGTLQSNRFISEGNRVFIQSQNTDSIAFRILKVYLNCNEGMGETIFSAAGDQEIQHTYVFEMTGPGACPKSADGGGGGGNNGSSVGLTPGWYMVIFGISILVVYIVAGIMIQHFKFDKTGKEIIPNYTFWIGLPGLIKDGAMFGVQKVKGVGGGSSTEYEKL